MFPIFTALSSKCDSEQLISISLACELDIGFGWNKRSSGDHALLRIFNKNYFVKSAECADKHIKTCFIRTWCNQASLFDSPLIKWALNCGGLQLNSIANALVSVWTDVHRDKIHKKYSSTPPFHESWGNAVSVIGLQCFSTTTQTQNLWWK